MFCLWMVTLLAARVMVMAFYLERKGKSRRVLSVQDGCGDVKMDVDTLLHHHQVLHDDLPTHSDSRLLGALV